MHPRAQLARSNRSRLASALISHKRTLVFARALHSPLTGRSQSSRCSPPTARAQRDSMDLDRISSIFLAALSFSLLALSAALRPKSVACSLART